LKQWIKNTDKHIAQ